MPWQEHDHWHEHDQWHEHESVHSEREPRFNREVDAHRHDPYSDRIGRAREQAIPIVDNIVEGEPGKQPNSEKESKSGVHFPAPGLEVNTVGTDQTSTDFTSLALKQAKAARRYEVASDCWVPQWVRVFIDSGGRPEELVQILIERVLQNPHESTLQEAQIVLSELGRGDEGAAQLHQQITRELLKELARLGCEADR
ncbi:hypothetical protein QU487_02985 [Crenobacter sp. SG2305]|uniref:hypothetical protein n=1 Tax=Crenobacter oryzisoli TaxID=3056844 RepID=UPI0025AAB97A|nr:hypothetical protein [Crenobacter sp. SG2305]MDN0081728.1 hypothetical protein [Crenobacter sp. SG2305]